MKKLIISLTTILFLPLPALAVELKFPWQQGVEWTWTQSWHGCLTQVCALDIATSGPYYEVLASTDSYVDVICSSDRTYDVKTIDTEGRVIWYNHIDKNTLESSIYDNAPLKQGQLIGKVIIGPFNEIMNCSNYSSHSGQSVPNGHIHFILDKDSHLIEGWAADYPTNSLTKNGLTVSSGYRFLSTNQPLLANYADLTGPRSYLLNKSVLITGNTFISGRNGPVNIKPN